MPSITAKNPSRGRPQAAVSVVLLIATAVMGFSACAGTGRDVAWQAAPLGQTYRVETRRYTQPGRKPGDTEGHFGKMIAYPVIVDTPDKALEKKINARIQAFIGLADLISRSRSAEVTYEQVAAPGHTLQFHFMFYLEGGAHPFTAETAIALDLKTANRYTLTDLLRSSGLVQLQRWAARDIKAYYQVGVVEDFQLDADTNFTFDDTRLYLYFSDCEVVSCAAGPARISIDLAKLKPHIEPAGPLAFILKAK